MENLAIPANMLMPIMMSTNSWPLITRVSSVARCLAPVLQLLFDPALIAQRLYLRGDVVAAVGDDPLEHADAVLELLVAGRVLSGLLGGLPGLQFHHVLAVLGPDREHRDAEHHQDRDKADELAEVHHA